MRVTEKLTRTPSGWAAAARLTHAISGVDIALWDILGKVTGQPIGRLLGGTYRTRVKALCVDPDGDAGPDARAHRVLPRPGFRAIKIGWGPFGRRESRKLDEAIVQAAREGAGDDCLLMVDAGASDAFWPNGLNWAVQHRRDAAATTMSYWFEEALVPDALDDFRQLRARSAVPIATGECLTRRQSYLPWFEARRARHRPARRHQGRRPL